MFVFYYFILILIFLIYWNYEYYLEAWINFNMQFLKSATFFKFLNIFYNCEHFLLIHDFIWNKKMEIRKYILIHEDF